MLDISVAYNRYKFVGHEFLTWLWFVIENESRHFYKTGDEAREIGIGNRMVLERGLENKIEKITIKGDDAGLEEGLMALRKGALVTEIHLTYKENDFTWSFTLIGESLSLSGLKLPETGPMASKDDIEATVLDKIYLYEKAIQMVQTLYAHFTKLRLSNDWSKTEIPAIRKWITSDRRLQEV